MSATTIPKSLDAKLDKEIPSNGHLNPGVSVRSGPVEDMEVDKPHTNGVANGKRSRNSMTNGKTYKEATSSEEDDDAPLVRHSIA